MSVNFTYVTLFSLFFLMLARKIAKKIGLVDTPNSRKCHKGQIPLVGGISIYAGNCFVLFIYMKNYIPYMKLYLFCTGILVITGVLDDRFNISVTTRVIVQALVSITMILFSKHHYIDSLGCILGHKEIFLGSLGYVLTLIAAWAAINAFNMVDGIDGLLGSLSCVSISAIGVMLKLNHKLVLAVWCFAIIATIIPYILLNLGLFGLRYKVFMGDAGSTMIGFTIVWLLLQSTQGYGRSMNPVTALWVIAIPLMDMINTIYRRITRGVSPFSPDCRHIHHIIICAGLSSHQAVIIITLTAMILALFGIAGEYWMHLSEFVMLLLWIIAFSVYSYFLKHFRYKIKLPN